MTEFLQVYSDKSNKTLKVSGLTLYNLHIKLMNFSEPMQHLMNSHGHRILYSLSVQFLYVHGDMYGGENSID